MLDEFLALFVGQQCEVWEKAMLDSATQLGELSNWLRTDPEVPNGKWFKKFSGMTVCGEGELVKTFLQPGQLPAGEEIN